MPIDRADTTGVTLPLAFATGVSSPAIRQASYMPSVLANSLVSMSGCS
jgi:hypothetical protein